MSGPTLGLGITATGVEQMRLLADSVDRLDKSLESLQKKQGGASAPQIGGLASLQTEVAKIRQGLGEATQGLRTDLADLKATISKSVSDSFTGIAKAAQTSSKQAAAGVKAASDETKNAIKAGADQVAAATAAAADKEEQATLLRSIKMRVSTMKWNLAQEEAAAKEAESANKLLFSRMTNFNKLTDAMEAQAVKDGVATDKRLFTTMSNIAKMRAASDAAAAAEEAGTDKQVFSTMSRIAKIVDAQNAAAAAEAASTDKRVFTTMANIAKLNAAQDAADEKSLLRSVKLMTSTMKASQAEEAANAKLVAAEVKAAAAEEAARVEIVARASAGLALYMQQRDKEIAQVTLKAQQLEAAYGLMSRAQQLRAQLKASSQLEEGISVSKVAAGVAPSAVSAAQATNTAALRAELERLTATAPKAASAAAEVGSALKGIHINSGVAREGLALVDEALQNRTKNMAGTFVVLLNRLGLASSIFSVLGISLIAAGAAVGGLAVAFAQGSVELSNFSKQATLTGDAIGLSASGFTQMRDSLVGISVTKGKAAEALNEIAASGLVAAGSVGEIAKTAIMLERAVGAPIKDTIKHFEELSNAPTASAAKLDEQYHFLTASTYSQIKALEDHGKKEEAAALAEKTFADSMQQRAQQILDGQGSIEKAWHAVGDAAKRAWDAMLDIGRQESMADKLKKASKALSDAEAQIDTKYDRSFQGTVDRRNAQAALPGLKSNVQDAFRRAEIESGNPIEDQQRIEETRARKEFESYRKLDKGEQLQRQIDRIRTSGTISGASPAEIEQAVKDARGAYDPRGNTGAASAQGKGEAAQAKADLLRGLMDANNYQSTERLTEAEVKLFTVMGQLSTANDTLTKSHLRAQVAALQDAVAKEKESNQIQDQRAAWVKDMEALDKLAEANDRSAESINQKAAQVEEENKHWGKNKTAIEEANLAQMHTQELEAMDSTRFSPAMVASIQNKTQAQERYVIALQKGEVHTEAKKLNEELRVQQEAAKTLDLEYSLVGKTADERARIVAERAAEVKLAKDLADIKKINATDPEAVAEKEQARIDAINKSRLEGENNARKATLQQWQKASDEIEKGLTDALMNGFNSGKNFAKTLRDYFKSMFANLILRPIIQATVAPIAGQLGGLQTLIGQTIQGGGAQGGGLSGGGIGSTLANNTGLLGAGYQALTGSFSGASTASLGYANAVGMMGGDSIGALAQGNGMWQGVSAGLGSTSSLGAGATTFGALDTGAGALSLGVGSTAVGTGSALAGATTFGAVDTGAAALSLGSEAVATGAGATAGGLGLAGMASMIPVIGWVIAAAAVLYSIFGQKSGGPKVDGKFGVLGSGVAKFDKDTTEQTNAAAKTAATSLQNQFDTIAQTYGVAKGSIQYGLGFSTDPKGKSPSFLDITGSRDGKVLTNDVNLNVGRNQEDLQKAIAEMGSRAILKGFQQSNLGGKIGQWLSTLNLGKMAAADVQEAITRFTKITNERQSLQDRLFNMTSTALQKLNKQRQTERDAIDETNKELLEQVYAQEDVVTAANNLLTAYNTQGAQITNLRAYAKSLYDFLDSVLLGDNSPLNIFEKLAVSAQDFSDMLALAHGGDANAQAALPGTASNYLDSIKATATDRVDFAMGVSKVASALATEAASATSQATIMDQQLATAKDSLVALGLINDNVQTFAQAWAAYNDAKDNLAAASAAVAAANAVTSAPADSGVSPDVAPSPYVVFGSGAAITSESAASFLNTDGGGDGGPGFADGGYHRGGVRLVGERGPELEVTGQSYIHDAAATRRMLKGGGGGNVDAQTTEELRGLRIEMRANVQATSQLSRDFRELKNRGFPVTNLPDGTALTTHGV